jgi:DNA-binding NtrC family response regulator
MSKARILVVDDNELFRDSIIETLRRRGYVAEGAANGPEGLRRFEQGSYELVVSDMKMPAMSGIELLQRVKALRPEVPFLIITAYGAIETAVEAMQKGAYSFIQKSDSLIEELELTVDRTLQFHSLVKENKELKNELHKRWDYIGSAAAMQEIRELVDTVAQSRSTVLITGESGTGKELIARSIHFLSNRRNGPFIKVNCAALPEGLIESELFGHEKGAFTGAVKDKAGKFELASGGTLLLDEIGEMATGVQAKLLRVLQEREINKVGGDTPVDVDVRVVATTNRDLEKEVQDGTFREDLFYRLNVFHINLPSLRRRKEDIPALVSHFIEKYNDENGFTVSGVEQSALEELVQYEWPGNIRELENALERAVVITRSGKIGANCFASLHKRPALAPTSSKAFEPGMSVAQAERELIMKTLEHCSQNRTRAAEMLGISIRTLRNKLHEYDGVELP